MHAQLLPERVQFPTRSALLLGGQVPLGILETNAGQPELVGRQGQRFEENLQFIELTIVRAVQGNLVHYPPEGSQYGTENLLQGSDSVGVLKSSHLELLVAELLYESPRWRLSLRLN